MINKLKTFLQESYQELKRVNWPTKQETIRYTIFVIGVSLVMAVFLGLLDFAFLQALERFILKI
jgi:preprotein translocase subunit SecE